MLRASSLGLNVSPLAKHHILKCCLTCGAGVRLSSVALKRTSQCPRSADNKPNISLNTDVAWGDHLPHTLHGESAKSLSYARKKLRKVNDSKTLQKPIPIPPPDHKLFRLPPAVPAVSRAPKQLVRHQPASEHRVTHSIGKPWRIVSTKRVHPREPRGARARKPVRREMSRTKDHISRENVDPRRVISLFCSLARTKSCEDGWKAYSSLLSIPQPYSRTHPVIPFTHLHRLCRLLSSKRPKTRTQFLRLLSVLSTLHNTGGRIHLHEWNALIDHAGKGWRKTSPEDFNLALDIFNDLVTGRAPGTTSSEPNLTPDGISVAQHPKPDIYTYTSLISIAARTLSGSAVRRATSLLQASGIPPNRITHLALLRYFTLTSQLSGVRSTLSKMRDQNLELGLDGVNACLWAYSNNHRADVAMTIYRLLRHNASPEPDHNIEEIKETARRLQEEEHIIISQETKADEITFTTMVQIMAYHGNFSAMLSVLMDMITSPNTEVGSPRARVEDDRPHPNTYSLNPPAFRAVFLGFSRHGSRFPRPTKRKAFSQLEQRTSPDQPTWTLENLWPLFHTFLAQPQKTMLSSSTAYWILVAFDKTSGHDTRTLRLVWKKLEKRFGQFWAERGRLRAWRLKLFPTEDTMN